MAEPDSDRLRVLAQVRRAASELARGRDGSALAPPEIRAQLETWVRRLREAHRELDEEGWQIGLLTLACFARQPGNGAASEGLGPPASENRG